MLESGEVTARELMSVLKEHPAIGYWYTQPLGGADGLTLEKHTAQVLESYEFFFEGKVSLILKNPYFKLMLAFHDLGKPKAVAEKRFEKQHEYTLNVISHIAEDADLPEKEIKKITTLVNGDPIGRCLNSKYRMPIEESHEMIRAMAKRLSAEIREIWCNLIVYYQCDVTGYESLKHKVFIVDSTGRPVYSEKYRRLLFKNVEELHRFLMLERIVLSH